MSSVSMQYWIGSRDLTAFRRTLHVKKKLIILIAWILLDTLSWGSNLNSLFISLLSKVTIHMYAESTLQWKISR